MRPTWESVGAMICDLGYRLIVTDDGGMIAGRAHRVTFYYDDHGEDCGWAWRTSRDSGPLNCTSEIEDILREGGT